jgi:iron(III) transport system permease protein
VEQDHGVIASAAGAPPRRWSFGLGIRPEVAILCVVVAAPLVFPLLLIVQSAFNVGDPEDIPATQFGFDHIIEVADHLDWIGHTLAVSAGGTILATLIGVVLAWILHRTTVPGARLFEILVTIPYPLGPLVGGLAWNTLGSPQGGLVNKIFSAATGLPGPLIDTSSMAGIIFVMAIFEAPVAVLMIGAAMQRMDPSLEECSSVMGAPTLRTALRITLPLMLPAILSAALFLFTSMMGSFAIPAILGANSRFYVVTTAIFILFQGYPPNYPLASALGLLLILITALAVWLYSRAVRGRSYVVVSGKSYRPRRIDMRRWTPLLLGLEILYILVALVLPLGVLIIASLQTSSVLSLSPASWTLQNFNYVIVDFPTTRTAIENSLLLGVGTGTIGMVLAAILALVVHRSGGRGVGLLEQLIMLPQSFPRLIFGFGFLWMVLTLPGHLYGTLIPVLLGYTVAFMPLAYRSMAGVVVQLDGSLAEAARLYGAGRIRAAWTITVPLLRGGLLVTWTLLFMVSIGEVSASIFLAGSNTPVLGPAILNFWESGGLPHVSALVVTQSLIVLLAMVLVRKVGGRNEGEIAVPKGMP